METVSPLTTADAPAILVVDDEAMIRCYAVCILEDAGYRTFEAADSDEALQQLNDHPDISVLFTDINMPGRMDGLALAHQVHARRPDMQVVVTSGRYPGGDVALPEKGCFLPKPYRMQTLMGAIGAEGTMTAQ